MNPIIGCDAHRRYSLFAVLDTSTLSTDQVRVNHQPGAIKEFLSDFPEGTPVALETVGNYYWIVDEIERAGCVPLLAHAAMRSWAISTRLTSSIHRVSQP